MNNDPWRVLVISDEEGLRKLAAISLADVGCEVVTAADGKSGLEACRQFDPHIVVIDILSPGMDGLEVLERIKKEDPCKEVIVMTDHGDVELAVRALRLKASDFIIKPINHEGFLAAVQRAKDHFSIQKNLRASEEKYSDLVENSLTGIYVDQNGKIVFANRQFADIYRYSKEEILGMDSWRLVHPDDRDMVQQIREKRIKEAGAPLEYESRGLTKDGRTVWVVRRNTRIMYQGKPAILGNIVNVSERHRHKEALRKSEEQYRRLARALILGLAEVFDALNELSWGNPKVRIPEGSEIDLIAELKSIVNQTAENVGEIVDLSHEFAMGLAEHFDVLYRVSKGDLSARVGGTSSVELLELFKGVTNQMIVSVSREILDRKRAEEKARTSEEKYRHMSHNLTVGLSEVFDALNQISLGNPHVRIPETSELELISDLKKIVNLTAENLGEIVDLSHEFAMGLAEYFDVLLRVSRGDLSARVSGASGVELLESLKEITNQTIRSVSREITERKRAEEALQEAHRELEERVRERTRELLEANERLTHEIEERKRAEQNVRMSEEKYRLLFNYDPNPLLVVDVGSGEILDTNNATTMTFGYGRDMLLNMSFWDFFSAEEAARARKELYAVTEAQYFFIPKLSAIRKDGKRFIVDLHARGTVKDVGTDPSGARLIIRIVDITRRLEQEANLIQTGKMATLGEMATGIAHELNQPLNVIQVGADFFSKMVSRGKEIPKDQMIKTCRNIGQQVDRATRIIDHLRDFGRKTDCDFYPVDINQPINDVFTLLGQQLRLRKIEVRTIFSKEPLMVLADKNRLEQIFLNLVTNARDAMDLKASGEKFLTITTYLDGESVVAKVSDTGIGIPLSVQEKIFQPFFTTKEMGKGTGLGLSISYNLVKDFGGDIEVESAEGQGATFTIRLPVCEKKDISKGQRRQGLASYQQTDP